MDIDDCHAILLHVASLGGIDMDKVSILGGSHGGFIAAHLLGKYPDVYKAGILRNPVTNIGAMVYLISTDFNI